MNKQKRENVLRSALEDTAQYVFVMDGEVAVYCSVCSAPNTSEILVCISATSSSLIMSSSTSSFRGVAFSQATTNAAEKALLEAYAGKLKTE
ncbi:MAG: hypothetical protein IJW50_08535 [Clostridia bacterium]|nr:hypothetical protein [Clostridia bacterium]